MLFDTHAHYYAEAFDPDRDAVLSALPAAGVGLVLCPGATWTPPASPSSWRRPTPCLRRRRGPPGGRPGAAGGLAGPGGGDDPPPQGEGHWGDRPGLLLEGGPRDLQKEVFRAQLQLAKVLDLPVIVHDREAHADCLAIVREFPGVRGVFHCYSGSAEDAKTLVKLGWHLSFTGTITFKNARKAPEVIAAVPLERIMVETDAPTWPPLPFGASGATPLCLPNGGDHCGDQGAHPGGSGAGHHGEWQGALCHSITGGPSGPEDFGEVFFVQGDIVTYDYFGGLYINMTNRCDCHCVFCIRDQEASALGGLWLQEEPAKEAVLAEILAQDLGQYTEIVFCGYGEPTCRADDLFWLCDQLRAAGRADLPPIRLNTNGHGSLINHRTSPRN